MIGFGLGPVSRAVQHLVVSAEPQPWTFVGAGAVTTITSGTSLVLPLHSPAQAGDLIVVQLSSTSALNSPQGTAVNAGTQTARYITAVGGETSLTFTLTSAATATGIAVTFRPVGAPGVLTGSSTFAGKPAVATSVAVSSLPSLITLTGSHIGSTGTAWTATLPVDSVVVASVPSNVGGTVRALYFAYKIQTTGTSTGTLTLAADAATNVRAIIGVFRVT